LPETHTIAQMYCLLEPPNDNSLNQKHNNIILKQMLLITTLAIDNGIRS